MFQTLLLPIMTFAIGTFVGFIVGWFGHKYISKKEVVFIHSILRANRNAIFKFYRGTSISTEKYVSDKKFIRVEIIIRDITLIFDIYRGKEFNKLKKIIRNRGQIDIDLSNIINICLPLASPTELFELIEYNS